MRTDPDTQPKCADILWTSETHQVKMKNYDRMKDMAANSYSKFPGDFKAAKADFLAGCKGRDFTPPRSLDWFVGYWGREWKQQGSVAGKASNSGAKLLISDTQAKVAVGVVLGWREEGRSGPYRSTKDLVKNNAAVKAIMKKTGASIKTLQRAMKRVHPTLSYKKLLVKAKLTAEHKTDRVRISKQNLASTDEELQTVVWIDAKTMYMNITQRYGWVDSLKEDIFETNRVSTRKSNIIKLKYYIAVNARLGGVMLVFYTGTTGMPAERDGKVYLVSASAVLSAQATYSLGGSLAC